MTSMRKLILLTVAGISFALPAQPQEVVQSPKAKALPNLLEPEIRALLKQGEFEQAKVRCTDALDATALVSEPGVSAAPFLCLGEALYGLKNYTAARVAFKNSIDQLTVSVGVFDPRLVQPLEGLGKTLMRLGKHEQAEVTLSRAKDLTHRNFGIYNLVQTDIVNRLTTSYFARGELTKASREQKFLLRANENTHGETPQLLPALRRMGKWQERVGHADWARRTYRRALRIMDRAYGPDDLRRVGPLRDYARSYINTPRGVDRVMSGAGARALIEVVNLHKRQEFTDAVDLAKAWGELGDWYIIGGSRRVAHAAYAEAGNVLRAANINAEGSALFSQPREIEFEDVPITLRPTRLGSRPDGIAMIEFEFSVSASGRVSKLVVVRDDLDFPRFAMEVGQRVIASRYRPRIVDGQAVNTDGVRKTFRYDFSSGAGAVRSKVSETTNANSEAPPGEAAEQSTTVDGDVNGDPAPNSTESTGTFDSDVTDVEETTDER